MKAWAAVPAPTGDLGRNLQDFPTAAEAAADGSDGRYLFFFYLDKSLGF